jgi:hypothetical protein
MKRLFGLAVLFVAAGFVFCGRPSEQDKFTKIVFPSGRAITAELAITEAERARGLMFREKIAPDQGMLFCFEQEDKHAFWMKNTLIPLDILWLDRDRRIVHMERNVPPCKADPCPSYPSLRPALYVLELGAGGVDLYQLKLFDRLEFAPPKIVR